MYQWNSNAVHVFWHTQAVEELQYYSSSTV